MKTARYYIVISIIAALFTISLKTAAYFVTGSIGLLSDALESVVNLAAAGVGFWALSFATQPPDPEHPFGHSKAEYFSSGIESVLIVIAALTIAVTAGDRLFNPQPIEQVNIGIALSIIASVINGAVAWLLFKAGKRLRSITLRADAEHLLSDVWTSLGVIIGVILVKITGWLFLDSIIGLIVAIQIVWTGIKLLQQTASELLDRSLPNEQQQEIKNILLNYEPQGIEFHALRTRVAGSRSFIYFHVLVPGKWSVKQGHDLCEEIELAVINALPGSHVMTHLEPIEDPVSWQDQGIGRD